VGLMKKFRKGNRINVVKLIELIELTIIKYGELVGNSVQDCAFCNHVGYKESKVIGCDIMLANCKLCPNAEVNTLIDVDVIHACLGWTSYPSIIAPRQARRRVKVLHEWWNLLGSLSQETISIEKARELQKEAHYI